MPGCAGFRSTTISCDFPWVNKNKIIKTKTSFWRILVDHERWKYILTLNLTAHIKNVKYMLTEVIYFLDLLPNRLQVEFELLKKFMYKHHNVKMLQKLTKNTYKTFSMHVHSTCKYLASFWMLRLPIHTYIIKINRIFSPQLLTTHWLMGKSKMTFHNWKQ